MSNKKANNGGAPLPPAVKDPNLEPKFKERKSEVKEISRDELVAMQIKLTKTMNTYHLINELHGKLEDTSDEHEIYYLRLGIEDLRSLLNNMLDKVDERLIEVMQDKGLREFESGPDNRKCCIYWGKIKDEKLTEIGYKFLSAMLKTDKPDVAFALGALPTSKSAWKIAKVKEIADTKGVKQRELIETTYRDKLGVQYIPKYIITFLKIARGEL